MSRRRRNHQSFFHLKPLTVSISHQVEIRDKNIRRQNHQLPFSKVHDIVNQLRINPCFEFGILVMKSELRWTLVVNKLTWFIGRQVMNWTSWLVEIY